MDHTVRVKSGIICILLFCTVVWAATNAGAIVVGTGFGGSVAALRLAEDGIHTIVLERGRSWQITDPTTDATFSTLRNPDPRASWYRNQTVAPGPYPYSGYPLPYITTGVLESLGTQINRNDPGLKIRTSGVNVLVGAGVGGGSLVYNAALIAPTESLFYTIFDDTELYSGLYEDLVGNWYPKVQGVINPQPIPDDILNSSYYLQARVFREQALAAGFPQGNYTHGITKLNLGIDWDVVRGEMNGTYVKSAIVAEVWLGMNSGAKNSLDRPGNYLDLARATGKIDLRPLHNVISIEYDEDQEIYKLQVLVLNQEDGSVNRTEEFTTPKLFLAAGSMATTSLLVRAKALGVLPRLNEWVGHLWGDNGDNFGLRQTGGIPTNPSQGGPAAFALHDHDNPLGPSVLMNVPVQWAADYGINDALTGLGMGIAAPVGYFVYDPVEDCVILNFPVLEKMGIINATNQLYDTLNAANNGSSGQLDPNPYVAAGTTAHPLGGVVLGRATDMYGRVIGYKGLYVVDGSLIPGAAGCVNPAFTVAALAERCVSRIISEDFDQNRKKEMLTFIIIGATMGSLGFCAVLIAILFAIYVRRSGRKKLSSTDSDYNLMKH